MSKKIKQPITNKDFELLKKYAYEKNTDEFCKLVNYFRNGIPQEEAHNCYETLIEIVKDVYFDSEREYLIKEYCLRYVDTLDANIFYYMVTQKVKKEIIPWLLKKTVGKSEQNIFSEWEGALLEHLGIIKHGILFGGEEEFYLSLHDFEGAFEYYFLFADLFMNSEWKLSPNRLYTKEMFEYTSKLKLDGIKDYVACRKTLEKFGLDPLKEESYSKQYRFYIKMRM